MDNVTEAVAWPRQQAALVTPRRRLVAYPQALADVLHTARALRRSPDTISVRDVAALGGSPRYVH